MSRKGELKKEIARCQQEIEALEKKVERSQAALFEAILTHTKPNDDDVKWFRTISAQIEEERKKLKELNEELKSL